MAQDSSSQEYAAAKACFQKLIGPEGKAAPKKEWDACIVAFDKIYEQYPDGLKATNALFSASRLRESLARNTKSKPDLESAAKSYNRLIHEHPESTLADDALYRMGTLRLEGFQQKDRAEVAYRYVLDKYPDSDMAPKAKEALAKLKKTGKEADEEKPVKKGADDEAFTGSAAGGKVEKTPEKGTIAAAKDDASRTVPENELEEEQPSRPIADVPADAFGRSVLLDIDVKESEGITTVRFSFDKPVEYAVEFTEFGVRTQSPPELEMSLLHTLFGPGVEREKLIETKSLESYTIKKRLLGSGLKVTFEMMPGADYDVRRNDTTITVRFGDRAGLKARAGTHAPAREGGKGGKDLSSFRIVIDPGHGGSDTGAVGPGGTLEKDVALDIAQALANTLQEKTRAKVFLTRNTDRTLTLDDRNAFALAKKADLFISIHANASEEGRQNGFETYYLNNATDAAAARLAQRENRSSRKKLSQVEHIISTMLMNYDTEESRVLADNVQSRLKGVMSRHNPKARNRGVRSALFYVLVGAKCPAILVETSFISNPREEKLLRDATYQEGVASAIGAGVTRYLRTIDQRLVSL